MSDQEKRTSASASSSGKRASSPAQSKSPRSSTEHTFVLPDGTELFYRAWLPESPTDKALLLFHRGHEHSGRFQDVVDELDLADVAIFAWDARGHGRSPGDRGYAPSFACLVKDLDCFVRHVSQEFQLRPENMVAMAQSVGAVILAAWVHDFAPPIRAMILAAPALRVKLYVPLAIPGLRLLNRIRGYQKSFVTSYVKSKMLTRDPEQARRYDDDPLITRSIAVNILVELHDAATRLIDDAAAIRTPTLVLVGGADWVVRTRDQERFFDRLGSPIKQIRRFPGMFHDVLHERDRHLVLDEARAFMRESFSRPVDRAPLLDADRRGHTREEYDRLRQPLPLVSPKRLAYAAQKLGMATLGRLSRGVELGWKTGFDSGQSLDYVYENRPQGLSIVGRALDRAYLASIGWKGIRQRKANLEKLLVEAIGRVRRSGRAVRLLDIAGGPGRYLLETIQRVTGKHSERGTGTFCSADASEAQPSSTSAAQNEPVPDAFRSADDLSALIRDNVPANLAAGRKLAEKLGLSDRVRFELGDAFDEDSLAAIDPAPNVSITSGLYELFPDNEPVLASLRGVARAMREGGYLIYTGQPWHPQVEMIARVLTNRDGKAWIMRRRTQQEMDDLIRAAGFRKLDMEIDDYGIFTVSLAAIGEVE